MIRIKGHDDISRSGTISTQRTILLDLLLPITQLHHILPTVTLFFAKMLLSHRVNLSSPPCPLSFFFHR